MPKSPEPKSFDHKRLPDKFTDDQLYKEQDRINDVAPEGTIAAVFYSERKLSHLIVRPGYCAITQDNDGNRRIFGAGVTETTPVGHIDQDIPVRYLWICPDPTLKSTGYTQEPMATYGLDHSSEGWMVFSRADFPFEEIDLSGAVKNK